MEVDGISPPSQTSPGSNCLGPFPTHDGGATALRPSVHHVVSEHDEFGTIVKEVNVVTTTTTTYKKYRIEEA